MQPAPSERNATPGPEAETPGWAAPGLHRHSVSYARSCLLQTGDRQRLEWVKSAALGREQVLPAHFRWTSTKRDDIPAAANLVQRKFHADQPNRVWASDITLLRTGQGWLHLVVILDLYSRRVVGWSMRSRPTQELVVEALQMAIADRRPEAGLIFHSDRGGQYLSYEVQEALDEHGFLASTSRPGNCLDNAVVETFFKTLKTEMYYHRHFATRAEARTAVFDFIATFYNPIRLHSFLDYESPEEYERALSAA